MINKIMLLLSMTVFLTSCVSRIGDFTVASSKNIDIKRTLHVVDTKCRVKGTDGKYIIIFIPVGTPNLKEAMDNAEEKAPNCVGLSDVTIKEGWWYIPYIVGYAWYEVEGNPVFEAKDGIPEKYNEPGNSSQPRQQRVSGKH
ncbi:MAG: hypothetical protein IJS08_06635 [Victivallales bacterium]|nr:hypothetical protein [Victivallales bacterium]